MKNITKISFVLLLIFQIQSCKKDKPLAPTITTSDISTITQTSASGGGTITSDGGSTIISRGICWSINNTPTENDKKTTNGAGAGSFVSTITGLSPNTIYFVRAYAINATGTGYGMAMSFTTLPATIPELNTSNVTNITLNSATCGGTITSDGAASITARGICWGTAVNPTILNSKTSDGVGTGNFISNITGLTGNTHYYVRAYATNTAGTSYGSQISFITSPLLSTLVTTTTSSITQTTATSGGNVTNDGGATVTARGVCWSTSANPTTANSKTINGTGTGVFTSSITGLTATTTYYLRAYATNSVGTSYGNEISFPTNSVVLPTLTTTAASSRTQSTAMSGGNLISDGGETITALGVCWSTSANPTIANNKTTNGIGAGGFASLITGLTTNTTYYVRAYATNSVGTGYGNNLSYISWMNMPGPGVTDVDGNSYTSVKLGSQQVWMVENLKTTKNRNGDLIGTTSPATLDISKQVSPKYQWAYDGNESNVATYGRLYTWYASHDYLCPTGWHVPSDAEWTTLTTYLGVDSVTGGILKEMGTTHWQSPNTGASNESGFTALPGGIRNNVGIFNYIGLYCYWWGSYPEATSWSGWFRLTYYNKSDVFRSSANKPSGLSVRCLMDY